MHLKKSRHVWNIPCSNVENFFTKPVLKGLALILSSGYFCQGSMRGSAGGSSPPFFCQTCAVTKPAYSSS
jgi:hypothetical protein